MYEKGGKTEPIVLDVDIIDVHEDSDEDEAAIDVIDILKSEGVEVDGEDQLGTLEAPSCCGQLSAARRCDCRYVHLEASSNDRT